LAFDSVSGAFLSDRQSEVVSADGLRALAVAGKEQTYTLVPRGCGKRMGMTVTRTVISTVTNSTSGPTGRSEVAGHEYASSFGRLVHQLHGFERKAAQSDVPRHR